MSIFFYSSSFSVCLRGQIEEWSKLCSPFVYSDLTQTRVHSIECRMLIGHCPSLPFSVCPTMRTMMMMVPPSAYHRHSLSFAHQRHGHFRRSSEGTDTLLACVCFPSLTHRVPFTLLLLFSNFLLFSCPPLPSCRVCAL